MWYVSLPDKWPMTWEEPGEGERRLLREFTNEDKARRWVNKGCPGTLQVPGEHDKPVFDLYHHGWNRRQATPGWFWLSQEAADALNAHEQRKKFAWFRWQARVSKHKPPLPAVPNEFPHEYIYDFDYFDDLAEAVLLQRHTFTTDTEKGLTPPPITDNM